MCFSLGAMGHFLIPVPLLIFCLVHDLGHIFLVFFIYSSTLITLGGEQNQGKHVLSSYLLYKERSEERKRVEFINSGKKFRFL
jgi:hypothetical protein